MLTDNHRQYLRNAFRHIEGEAQDAIALLLGEDEAALFARYRDFPDAERIGRVRAHLVRLRAAMRRFMDAQGIDHGDVSTIDACWAFETRLALARNAVIELRPRYVRGYGELDEEDARACRALAAELGQLLDAMIGELRRGALRWPPEGVADALLEATAEAIEHHHLLEYRHRVETLLAHPGETVVELALLGRVSSGKSSLVNALLGHDLLPVGAVPVTAVTTRIRHGDVAQAHSVDIDGQVREVSLDDLHRYIDEAGNPGNRLRLREVDVCWPADWLKQGVVLADTPGLGSLHARASAHALDYLPRCDLGIVTIDAASTLTPQDVDLVRALRDASAGWLVLLSKADTVSATALAQQRDYVGQALGEALGVPVVVAAVSVAADRHTDLEQWRREKLEPALADAREQSSKRRHARVVALAQRVSAALRQALAETHGDKAEDTQAQQRRGGVLAELEDLGGRLRTLYRGLAERGAAAVIDEVADQPGGAHEVAATVLAERASVLADAVVSDAVAGLRDLADQAGADADAVIRGVPPFVAPAVLSAPLRLPPGPKPLRRAWLRHRLESQAGPALQTAFATYSGELKDWTTSTIRQLRRQLADAREATGLETSDRAALEADLQRIKKLLEG